MSELNPIGGTPADGTRIVRSPLDAILRGGGEAGALMRAMDWSKTPLGPPSGWPQSLRTSVSIVLASRFPLSIWWGPEYAFLYNDAHALMLGRKHPQALGRPALEVWAEIKDIIGPMLDGVVQTGKATWSADRMLPLERNGFLEECYFTWSYSPILVESGAVGGVFTVATETTERHVGARRQRTLRALGEAGAGARSLHEALQAVVAVIDPADVPFALIYRADPGASRAELVAGGPIGAAAPSYIELGDDSAWPLGDAEQRHASCTVTDLGRRFGAVTGGRWPEPTHTAIVHALAPDRASMRFWLVTGVSPRRPLDDTYRGFLELLARQVQASIAAAHAHEQSQRRAEQLAEPNNELHARVATHLELGRLRRIAEFERARMYSLFMQVPAAVAMFSGPLHRVIFANPRYWEICGRSQAEDLNKPVLEIFPEIAGTGLVEIIDTVYSTGRTIRNPRFQVHWDRRQDGQLSTGYFDWTCQPIRDPEGRIEGTIQFFFDVTERVHAQEELDEARVAAEAANRAKDEFLAMLGHELRNPLAPIVTAVHLLRLQGGNGRELDVIDRQVGHLTRLVDDLLDISRITRGKVELRREMVELADVVARALETVSPLLEQRSHPVIVDVPERGLVVDGDVGRLVQVVANLLTNASKYSEPCSPIAITGRALDGHVELRVKDEGIGLAPEQLDRIFEMFVQQPQAADRAQGGLGLGLALVRSLVELHGGSVRAMSDGPGQGSEFIVTLPRADVVAPADTDSPEARQAADPQATPRVLVVDDNFDGAQLLQMALDTFGYEARMAHDGPSALAIAAEFRPDVVLLDIGLPVMDGYEVARRLQAEPFGADVRIIAVTGYGQESDRRRSQAAGFVAHIVKPVDLAALQRTLSEHARAAS